MKETMTPSQKLTHRLWAWVFDEMSGLRFAKPFDPAGRHLLENDSDEEEYIIPCTMSFWDIQEERYVNIEGGFFRTILRPKLLAFARMWRNTVRRENVRRPPVLLFSKISSGVTSDYIIVESCGDIALVEKYLPGSARRFTDETNGIMALAVPELPSPSLLCHCEEQRIRDCDIIGMSKRFYAELEGDSIRIRGVWIAARTVKQIAGEGFAWNRKTQSWIAPATPKRKEFIQELIARDVPPPPSNHLPE